MYQPLLVKEYPSHMRELWELANSFAFELKDKGCKSGDVVAISIGNHPYHIVAILSVALANGVFLPLDEPIPKTRKEEILLDSGAKYVIKSRGHNPSPNSHYLLGRPCNQGK